MKTFAILGLAATLCLTFAFSAFADEASTMTTPQELKKNVQAICKKSAKSRNCKKATKSVRNACKADVNAQNCKDAVNKLKTDYPSKKQV